jgi:RNA polymerase sigma factor (sigma-70 family)
MDWVVLSSRSAQFEKKCTQIRLPVQYPYGQRGQEKSSMQERWPTSDSKSGEQPSLAAVSDAELLGRFVRQRDEAAFADLMARHGPMVFGVCRHLLRHVQDAEDAFQATFLVLARKAGQIGRREMLANWLYGVAVRVAARARRTATRRHTHEITDMERVAAATGGSSEATDLSATVTEVVQRLPAKYRGPIILCYLEGRTNEEAATELRCPIGTVKGRLARAREMLRKGLIRRGLALSTAALSAALSAQALAAPLSPVLIDSTLRAAVCFAAGDAAAGGFVSTQAAALTKGVLHTMFVTKMKTVAVLILALAIIAGGVGMFAYHLQATEAEAKKTDKEKIQGEWKVESVTLNGKEPPDAEQVKSATWIIGAEKITVKAGDKNLESTYKIDPSVTPKTIDVTSKVEGDKGRTMLGIYTLDGDTLKICSNLIGDDRPSELASKEGSNAMLVVLNRLKK